MNAIIIRPAPSGKVYVVWHGHPICDEDGGLRYFNTEEEVRDTLERCDLVLTAVGDATLQKLARSRHGQATRIDLAHSYSRNGGAPGVERKVGSAEDAAEEMVTGDFANDRTLLGNKRGRSECARQVGADPLCFEA